MKDKIMEYEKNNNLEITRLSDGKIIYYTLEKRKTVKNMETIHCPNCGALNDTEITGKVRCTYCNSIVVGSKFHELDHLDGILHMDIAEQIINMPKKERKKYRETHPYEIISKTCKYEDKVKQLLK